jgi:putative transcriptional regulator
MGKFADELNASLQEALAHAEGQTGTTTSHVVMVPDDVDVESIRKGLGLSRPAFCLRFGLDVRAVQDWEQKRCRPKRAPSIGSGQGHALDVLKAKGYVTCNEWEALIWHRAQQSGSISTGVISGQQVFAPCKSGCRIRAAPALPRSATGNPCWPLRPIQPMPTCRPSWMTP